MQWLISGGSYESGDTEAAVECHARGIFMIELRWLATKFPDGYRERRLQFRTLKEGLAEWTEWQDVPVVWEWAS